MATRSPVWRIFRGLAPVAAISSFARSASPECADPSREVDALPEPLARFGPLVGAAAAD